MDRQSSATSVPASSQAGPSLAAPPTLLAADENGNISVVSDIPVSPRTMTHPLPAESEQIEVPHSGTDPSGDQATAPIQNGRPAMALSEEIEAVDAAETSTMADSSLAVPPANGEASSSSASPGLSDKADQPGSSGRRKSSFAGASNDPVESRTRMTTLPAKPKTEEIKHRADFERMMMAAKEVERKKREEEEERKRRRQDEQRAALGRWEKEILPSWSRARKDPELAEMWWKGAPPSIRGRIWALAIGNPLMLPRNLLDQSEKKAAGSGNRPIQEVIPPRVLDQIDDDVADTLPSLKLFQENGPLHEDLVRLCRAFVLVRIEQVAELDGAGNADRAASKHQNASPLLRKADLPDGDDEATQQEGKKEEDEYSRRGLELYRPGLSTLAAVLLINMPINTAFIALLNLLHSKPWLKATYSLLPTTVPPSTSSPKSNTPRKLGAGSAYQLSPKEKSIRAFERVLETLLADQMPKVFANLLSCNVKLYRVALRDWVGTLWGRWLDVDTVMRLWDVVLLDETDSMIYRVCLGLVQVLESRLYVHDQDELESVLKGTNKAALAIWRREKEASGELEVHLRSPRHSRGSISMTTSGDESTSALSSSSVPESPPPRSSSLTQEEKEALHRQRQDSTTSTIAAEEVFPRDYIYEQYAIKEDLIFDTLDAQKAWWKPSTLQRLLDRELSE